MLRGLAGSWEEAEATALNETVGYLATWGGNGEQMARDFAGEFLRAFPGESRVFLNHPASGKIEDDFWTLTLFGPWDDPEEGGAVIEPMLAYERANGMWEEWEDVEPDPMRYDEEITLA